MHLFNREWMKEKKNRFFQWHFLTSIHNIVYNYWHHKCISQRVIRLPLHITTKPSPEHRPELQMSWIIDWNHLHRNPFLVYYFSKTVFTVKTSHITLHPRAEHKVRQISWANKWYNQKKTKRKERKGATNVSSIIFNSSHFHVFASILNT